MLFSLFENAIAVMHVRKFKLFCILFKGNNAFISLNQSVTMNII